MDLIGCEQIDLQLLVISLGGLNHRMGRSQTAIFADDYGSYRTPLPLVIIGHTTSGTEKLITIFSVLYSFFFLLEVCKLSCCEVFPCFVVDSDTSATPNQVPQGPAEKPGIVSQYIMRNCTYTYVCVCVLHHFTKLCASINSRSISGTCNRH